MNQSPTPSLDVDYVRHCFPAFDQPLPAKTAFFENAGGSYVAGTVLDKLFHFYLANKVQPYGPSEICHAAGEQMDLGRQTIADLLGVGKASVTLGPSTTQNINTLAIASASIVGPGSKIIVSGQDHEANIGAWERLCQRTGAEIVAWPVDPDSGELSLETFTQLLDESVKLICMTHSSNIIGSINAVDQVIAQARQIGARVVVDGVSYAPHQWPDLPGLQPDAYCFSTYKTYATHLGVMVTAPEFARELDPQCHYFNLDYPEKRFDAAGPDHASIAALAGLGDYFSASHDHHFGASGATLNEKALAVSGLMHQHETDLCAQLLEVISELPMRVIGRSNMQGREANIAVVSDRYSSEQLSQFLASKDIAAGSGHFYARRLLENAGVQNPEDGVLRISFAHYNTQDEVSRLNDALRELH